LLFRFLSYCHFVFYTALSTSQSIFSMLYNVSAMLSLVGTGQVMSKIWPFSRIFVKIDQSYFFKNFNYAFRCPRKTLKAIDCRRSWRIRFQLLKHQNRAPSEEKMTNYLKLNKTWSNGTPFHLLFITKKLQLHIHHHITPKTWNF